MKNKTKTVQATLWEKITSNIGDYGIYEKCETQRAIELEKLYDEQCDRFAAILDGEYKDAFACIRDLALSAKYEQQEIGVAMGLCIAKELRDLIERPNVALQEDSKSLSPVEEAEKTNIEDFESAIARTRTTAWGN